MASATFETKTKRRHKRKKAQKIRSRRKRAVLRKLAN